MAVRSETTSPRPPRQPARLQRAFSPHLSALTPQPAPAPSATPLHPSLKPLRHLFKYFPWPGKPFPSCPPRKGCFILRTALTCCSLPQSPPPCPAPAQAEPPLLCPQFRTLSQTRCTHREGQDPVPLYFQHPAWSHATSRHSVNEGPHRHDGGPIRL